MNDLMIVIFFSLIGSVFSLIGGFLLLANKRKAERLLKYVTPFAAGALLAAAFIDVLPEAAHEGNIELALRWTLVGILAFFLLERFIRWFHRHNPRRQLDTDATIPLIVVGDTVHNFIDGIAIAAAFLIDIPTGIVVTLAVATHEIPQEVGDFGLLLDKGMGRLSVVKVNIFSAVVTTVAAAVFYLFGDILRIPLESLLGLVAGFFIYIAVSDIIPQIHKNEGHKFASLQTAMLIAGALIVGLGTASLHGIIDAKGTEDERSSMRAHEAE